MNRIPILLKNRGITSWILALIAGFIFLNPFPHVTALKEISFYAAVGLICGSIALKRTSFRFTAPLTFPFLLIFLWASIGIFFAVDKANTIHDLYAHFIKYVAMYYLIVNIFRFQGQAEPHSHGPSFCPRRASASGAYLIFISSWVIPSDTNWVSRSSRRSDQYHRIVTVFGILLSLQMLSLESRTQHKIAIIFMLALMVLATLLTQTRSTFLALFCVLVILSLRNRRMLIVIVAIVMLISILPIKNRLTPSAILDKLGKDPRISISYTYIEVIKEFRFTASASGCSPTQRPIF